MGFQAPAPSTPGQVLKRPKPGQAAWTPCYSPRLPTSWRPRATPPHRLDQELCFWGCRGPSPPAPAARRSLGDYWLSPQRRLPPGAAWRWPARNLLLLPGATGLADIPSARWPSCYGARPRLTWTHRWQNINYQFLGKRKRHLVPLRPSQILLGPRFAEGEGSQASPFLQPPAMSGG
ncbi:hypothetical protein QTO34_018826 [Cnephaeus nilssonii]|uniref:Uncharacterized protein n=1 Tax=Cnephaeus nilssonii TaxID=3371016 RepID=A0AA40LP61_CNENI|nr:hypothetical protein QTO34_018826 [Eptesicus nilssonii]